MLSSIIIFIVLFAVDLVTKYLICPNVIAEGGTLAFIPGVLRFEYTENTGMAWGMLKNATLLLTIFTVIACAGIIFFLIKRGATMPKLIRIALIMILAGAVGNLFDRVVLGYVRDFIAFDFIDFPIFNFADACVSVGAVLLFAGVILTKNGREFFRTLDDNKDKKTEETEEAKEPAEND